MKIGAQQLQHNCMEGNLADALMSFFYKHSHVVIPPWSRWSEYGHHILHVSCTMDKTNNHKISEGTDRENGGFDKHLGQILLKDLYPR